MSRGKIKQTFSGRYMLDIYILGKRYKKMFDTIEMAQECRQAVQTIKDKNVRDGLIDNVVEMLKKRKT